MGKKNKQRTAETFDDQELQNQDAVVKEVSRSVAWFSSKYDYISIQNCRTAETRSLYFIFEATNQKYEQDAVLRSSSLP